MKREKHILSLLLALVMNGVMLLGLATTAFAATVEMTQCKEYGTGENGKIHINGLHIGNNVFSEVSNEATAAYVMPDDITGTVFADKTSAKTFFNESKPEIPDVPKTDDTTNIGFWVALCAVFLAGIGATAFLGFQKKKTKESED